MTILNILREETYLLSDPKVAWKDNKYKLTASETIVKALIGEIASQSGILYSDGYSDPVKWTKVVIPLLGSIDIEITNAPGFTISKIN